MMLGAFAALLLTATRTLPAQDARFFRIAGPTATKILAFRPDGSLVWSNALAGTNYTVQTATSLAGGTNWVDYVQLPVTNRVNTNLLISYSSPSGMVLIPAGSFLIGNYLVNNFYNTATNDPDITDANPANVYVSAFYMDVNLVSSNQWAGVYSYATGKGYAFALPGLAKAGNHPITSMDWYDCVAWCNARSQQAGLTPCYYTDASFTQVYTNATGTNVYLNMVNNGYRLPTEAEWEKAARGGLTGNRFPWGNIITEGQANYQALPASYSYDLGPYSGYNTNFNFNSGFPYTSPVGSFAPNGYGLYDMAGNVFEWCWDWYAGPPYPAGSPYMGGSNPTGAGPGSGYRVLRGGSWVDYANFARCAVRSGNLPNLASDLIGFRCVRGL